MAKLDYNEDDIQFVVELTGKTPDKAEKYILDTYKDLEDDEANIFDVLDVIEWEIKRKQENKREYVKSDKPREKKQKERKIDNEKLELLELLGNALTEEKQIEVTFENEVKLHFKYGGNAYTVTLTKHRAKK